MPPLFVWKDKFATTFVRDSWVIQRNEIMASDNIEHARSLEYALRIMDTIVTDKPYKIGGNVINNILITIFRRCFRCVFPYG